MKPTLNLNDKNFELMLFDFCKLFFFWKEYIENNIKHLVHTTTLLKTNFKNYNKISKYVRLIKNKSTIKIKYIAGEPLIFLRFLKIPENKSE